MPEEEQITPESQDGLSSEISVRLIELGASCKGIKNIHDQVYELFKLFTKYSDNNRMLLNKPKDNVTL